MQRQGLATHLHEKPDEAAGTISGPQPGTCKSRPRSLIVATQEMITTSNTILDQGAWCECLTRHKRSMPRRSVSRGLQASTLTSLGQASRLRVSKISLPLDYY